MLNTPNKTEVNELIAKKLESSCVNLNKKMYLKLKGNENVD